MFCMLQAVILLPISPACVHCISTWLIGCSCTRLAQTGHASWGARRHDRGKVARGLDQEAIFTFQRSCQVLNTWPVPSTSKSPRQAGMAPALWEQSLNLAYRNPDSKVPGTCGLAQMLLVTNEPLTRPHATRCSLASACILRLEQYRRCPCKAALP